MEIIERMCWRIKQRNINKSSGQDVQPRRPRKRARASSQEAESQPLKEEQLKELIDSDLDLSDQIREQFRNAERTLKDNAPQMQDKRQHPEEESSRPKSSDESDAPKKKSKPQGSASKREETSPKSDFVERHARTTRRRWDERMKEAPWRRKAAESA